MSRSVKTSSGDRTADPCRYLFNVPDQERVKSPYAIIREGHIKAQIYKVVRMVHIETGEEIYRKSL